MLSLPMEILNDILLRLPVKCLGQCKCVSKFCRSLISDKEFVKLHLNRAISDPEHWRLFTFYPFYSLRCGSRYNFEDEDSDDEYDNYDLVELSLPSDQRPDFDPYVDGSVELVGSSNGLICLCYTPNRFKVWNPTIKESRDIPEPTIPFEFDARNLPFLGFGYNPSGDDYNLVTCVYLSDSNTYVVEVFGLKVGSWTRIEHNLEDFSVDDSPEVGTYLNWALHWEVTRGVEPYKSKSVICLHLGGEKYELGEILVPNVPDKSVLFHTLLTIEGCIGLLSNEKGRKLGIWVMKEYGVRESWSRIALLNLRGSLYAFNYVEPLFFAENGDIIVDVDRQSLVRYNIKDGSSRRLKKVYGLLEYESYIVDVESLVSPNSCYP